MPSEILKTHANLFEKYIHLNFNILDINSLFVKILKILLSEKSSYRFLIVKLSPHKMHLAVHENQSAQNQSKLLFAKLSPHKNLSTEGILLTFYI